MKIRKGYVSNSSTASFVVEVRDFFKSKDKLLISKEKINKLVGYGFRWMDGFVQNIVFMPGNEKKSFADFKDNENANLYFDVICNEDEVYEFLFRNRIPFIASIHYDHELWVYRGGSYYEIFTNYAVQYLMNDSSKFTRDMFINKFIPLSKPYRKVYLNKKNNEDSSVSDTILLLEKYEKVCAKFAKKKFSQQEWKKIEDFLHDIRGNEFYKEIKKIKSF